MKCLIVDDQIENRMVLAKIMEPYAQCDQAIDGAEAVELFTLHLNEGTPYELVLMDIMMPVMDGQEALRKMRELEDEAGILQENQSAIVMVTAVDATSEMKRAFEEGRCTGYINKPINRGKILVKLSELGISPKVWW
ncbi:MAG: response regulator [Magnetococcales bacterium]|nr:response regulator [Magnetococcales bacterium]MBF0151718.1 response regulator [Magnetococcales bacterium]MBF0171899.1 response regulator [Magnetococcales bacterium]MBF0347199.1 response regulator [Magnetococcales bacterium]